MIWKATTSVNKVLDNLSCIFQGKEEILQIRMSDHREDLFCSKCCLKFNSDFIFGRHLSLVHGKKKGKKGSKNKGNTYT